MAEAGLQRGLVVAGHGRHVWVETPDGQRRICHPRGKKSATVVGDEVLWKPSQDEGTIEKVEPRRNLLYRQDEIRTKMFAANLDLVVILIAAEPEFSEQQLARALIACEAERIPVLIGLNKEDLSEPFARAWEKLAPYRAMGYTVLPLALNPGSPEVAAQKGLAELLGHMQGKKSLVLGPSGSGKSTLINCLIPNAGVLTNSISTALNSGKHTTTSTTLYWLDAERTTGVMDSPGFQEFGLAHIAPQDLASWMPDIRAHAQNCKFYNCTHLHEPGCGVISATKSGASPGEISTSRYSIYSVLHEELSQKRF
ncbi:ribosome small subunit-dependent GTPase A [Curvibacter sp. APW13]|uniref:ribosome small subunit-dependent GTPase A n=1 Tax=Curvibacter sp. APW13 TaxID=3077236 RepID=UPI0028E07EA5|nr:ribosome small subunit-dependent GTPase A [Curvibacter sp. APW13]MDT8989382.1 ribosome small subunit-dependent GTPase A [Curvibacter sp. APW13]